MTYEPIDDDGALRCVPECDSDIAVITAALRLMVPSAHVPSATSTVGGDLGDGWYRLYTINTREFRLWDLLADPQAYGRVSLGVHNAKACLIWQYDSRPVSFGHAAAMTSEGSIILHEAKHRG